MTMPHSHLAAIVLSYLALNGCSQASLLDYPDPHTTEAAVAFDRSTCYGEVRNGKAFDLPAFTLSTWLRLEERIEPQVFINRGGLDELFSLYLEGKQVRMLVETMPGKSLQVSAKLGRLEQWVQYTGTFDGRQLAIYKDGVLAEKVEAPGRMPQSSRPLYLGTEAPFLHGTIGSMKGTRIFSRALRADEVKMLHEGQPVASESLLAFWNGLTDGGRTWQNQARSELSARLVKEVPSRQEDGYRGIWYANQPSGDRYRFKYSGGLATYPQQHLPIAWCSKKAHKTFFT